ncbi:hypothetical protein SAMN05443634_10256 [Chishuiella changwenlii]|jgi:hypothetical protein|uniref:DUF4834 domain-containing protein n=1 Tax=Chishuiella changwenlii TaxID=1434701 RepID=A0A1M6TR69_9FLAO|nr:hypothetical protein [Chishuiella changwenlii]GGF04055.1 hypothetical protein GCM10010984_21730 [Chishuiella changwenlii]SHK59436.1 hypothetical protein SAMN05443634_10256 [Chishuiella changwenlii]
MKTILWILVLGIIFLTIFRFLRKVFAIKKVFKDALNQQQNAYNQSQNNNDSQQRESQSNQSFDKPKFNIDAETVDYEIIEEKKDEK